MGNKQSHDDYKRRHTFTSASPYIKQNGYKMPQLPHITSTQDNCIQAKLPENKTSKTTQRAASTPTSPRHLFKRATFDYAANTQHQHLVSSLHQVSKAPNKKSSC